jgi:hypothetical protein
MYCPPFHSWFDYVLILVGSFVVGTLLGSGLQHLLDLAPQLLESYRKRRARRKLRHAYSHILHTWAFSKESFGEGDWIAIVYMSIALGFLNLEIDGYPCADLSGVREQ